MAGNYPVLQGAEPFYFEGNNNSTIKEIPKTKRLVKTIDFLGRETKQEGLYMNIYEDGTVKKLQR